MNANEQIRISIEAVVAGKQDISALIQQLGTLGTATSNVDRETKQWANDWGGLLDQALKRVRNEVQAGIASQDRLTAALKTQKGVLTGVMAEVTRGSAAYDVYVGKLAQVQQELDRVGQGTGRFQGIWAGLSQGVQSSGLLGHLGGLTSSLGAIEGGMGGVAAAAGPLGIAVGAVTAAVGASLLVVNRAVDVYADFEQRMAGVSTLTDKLPAQLGSAGREILQMSTDLGMSFQDLSSGLSDVLGAGVRGTEDMNQALAFTREAAKLAIAGQTQTAVATDVLTSVMNAYKMEASETKSVSDGLFAAVRDGKMTFEQLAQSLGMVTAISADAKVPLQTVLAALATMTAGGVQASSSVDYLRSMISAIINPSDKAAKTAAALGIEFNAQALESKGLVVVLKDVMTATNGNKDKMGDLLGGVEAVTAATSIASGNFERMETNLKNQATAAGTTETAYQKMADTIKKENDKVDANWQKLMVNMGEAFAPLKKQVLEGVNEMLNSFNSWLEKSNMQNAQTTSNRELSILEGKIAQLEKAEARLKKGLWTVGFGTLDDVQKELAKLRGEYEKAMQARRELNAQQFAANIANGTIPAPNTGRAKAGVGDLTQLGSDIAYQAIKKTGDKAADDFVNYCAKWVRLQLEKADPRIVKQTRQLFQKDANGDGNQTAADAAQNARAAGLMRQYKNTKDLKPGDIVFYDDGGDGHVGIYIGGGMVRGNNRVSYKATGNPVGDVDINRLGRVAGYVAAESLSARAGLTERDLRSATSPTNTGNSGNSDKDAPVTAAMIAKARELYALVEKTQKAAQAKPGDDTLALAYSKAKTNLQAWTKASEAHKAALDAVTGTQEKNNRSTQDYVATVKDIQKYGNQALRYYKDLKEAEESGNASRIAAAKTNLNTWLGESKVRKAVLDDEKKAYEARKATDKKNESDAKEAAQNRLKIQQGLQDALQKGKTEDAQRLLAQAKQLQQTELDLARDSAVKRAEIIRKTTPAILDAEYKLAELKRRATITANQRAYDEAASKPGANLVTLRETQRNLNLQAFATEKADREKARTDQATAQRQANQTALQAQQQHEKERKKLIAQAAQEARELRYQESDATLNRIKSNNKAELEAFEGSVDERLELIKRQTQAEYEAAEVVARIKRNNALRDSANKGGKNQAARDARIEQDYTDYVQGLKNTRIATVREATKAADDYWKAALKDADQYKNVSDHFTRLKDGAKGAGGAVAGFVLSIEDAVNGLPEATEAQADYLAGLKLLEQNGTAAAGAVNAVTAAIEQKTRAEQAAIQEASDLFMLDTFGGGAEGLKRIFDAFGVSGIDQLKLIDPEAAAQVGRVFKSTLAAMQADLEKQAQAGYAVLENFKAEADALADETQRNSDRAVDDKNAFDAARVNQLARSGAGTMLAFLNKPGKAFGDSYWTALGEQGRAAFTAKFMEFKPEDFARLGVVALQGVLARIGNAPEWAEIKAKVQAGFEAALDARSLTSAGDAIGKIIQQYDGLDLAADNAARTIEEVLIPALQAIAASSNDTNLKAYIQDAIDVMKGGVQTAKEFAGYARDIKAQLAEGDAVSPAAEKITALSDAFDKGELSGQTLRLELLKLRPELKRLADAGNEAAKALLTGLDDAMGTLANRTKALNDRELARLEATQGKSLQSRRAYLNRKQQLDEQAAQDEYDTAVAGGADVQTAAATLEATLIRIRKTGSDARQQLMQAELDRLTANFQKAGQIAKMFTDGGENAVSILGDWVTMNTTAYKQFQSGDVGGAILTTIQGILNVGESLANLNPRLREYKKNMLEIAQLEKSAMGSKTYGNIKNPYYDDLAQDAANREKLGNSKWYQRLWWDLTGGAPKVMEDGAAKLKAKAATIFGELANSINTLWNNAWEKAFTSGTSLDLTANLTKMLNLEVAKEAMAQVLEKANIGEYLKAYTEARAAGQSGEAQLEALRQALIKAGQDADAILKTLPGYGGTPEERATREKQKALQTAEELRSIEEQQNELLYTQGKRSRAEYEREKLRLAQERIRLEMEGEIARLQAAGATEEEINRLRQRYLLTAEQQQAEYDRQQRERQAQFAKDLSGLRMNNAETALSIEEKLMMSTARTEEEKYAVALKYAEKRAELTRARLKIEEAAAIAEVDMSLQGADQMVAAIREKYKLLGEEVDAELEIMANNRANQLAEQARVEQEKATEEAKRARESMIQSWHQALSGGVSALLNGDSPLNAMYEGVRNRMAQAIQDGFVVKRILGKLDPLFDQLDQALSKGFDVSGIIAQIGAALPGLSVEMQASLGPIFAALNTSIPKLTTAVNDNTKAVKELQMMQTTVVQFRNVGQVSDRTPARLARFV